MLPGPASCDILAGYPDHHSEPTMLRFTVALLFAMVVSGTGISAEQAMARRSWHRAAVILPAGLPRPHYHFRTTISYGTPYTYRRSYGPRVSVYCTGLTTPMSRTSRL
jgi:hypothetical protein